jgi:hypothetical protein
MMAIENPPLSLKRLNDIESKFLNATATSEELQEIDFFISSVGGAQGYIKNILTQNGFRDYVHYLKQKQEDNSDTKVQVSRVNGAILGAMSFLKTYAIKNKFFV